VQNEELEERHPNEENKVEGDAASFGPEEGHNARWPSTEFTLLGLP
jgi:hypothetical protein